MITIKRNSKKRRILKCTDLYVCSNISVSGSLFFRERVNTFYEIMATAVTIENPFIYITCMQGIILGGSLDV